MKANVYLSLIILSGTLFPEMKTLPEANIKKPPDYHVRKKRVIDERPHRKIARIQMEDTAYLIHILANRTISRCAGSLLNHHVVITAAHCFRQPSGTTYSIKVGSTARFGGHEHKIIHIERHPDSYSSPYHNDLALVGFHPPINFRISPNRPIGLYDEHSLPENAEGTITSWGCDGVVRGVNTYPNHVRAITVPIIKHEECNRIYSGIYSVTSYNICTYYKNRLQRCSIGDSGAPLVVNGKIVGIMSWGPTIGLPHYPDVFMNLLHPDYKNWVLTTLRTVFSIDS